MPLDCDMSPCHSLVMCTFILKLTDNSVIINFTGTISLQLSQ